MAIYTQRNALNLVPGESAQLVVHLSQGAAGVAVEFYLYNGGVPYEPEGAAIAVHGVRKDGTGFGPVACSYIGNVVTFETTEEMAAIAGPALAELTITDENGDTTGTANFAMLIEEGTFPEGPAYDTDISVYQQILAYCQSFPASVDGHAEALVNAEAATRAAADTALSQSIATAVGNEATARAAADTNLQTQISRLQNAVGGPNVALTAADFTDITKVYVVAGTIAGMTTGDWYYWDGTAWVSGGVYNSAAVQTDPTLSVPGMAADAASCGDLKSAINDVLLPIHTPLTNGYLSSQGVISSPDAYGENTSDYIPVRKGMKIRFVGTWSGGLSGNSANWAAYCLFRANKSCILDVGRITIIDSVVQQSVDYTIEITNAEAAYLRVSWRTFGTTPNIRFLQENVYDEVIEIEDRLNVYEGKIAVVYQNRAISSGTDFNNVTDAGYYVLAGSASYSNAPIASYFGSCMLEVYPVLSDTYVMQTFTRETTGQTWFRFRSADTWSQWYNGITHFDNKGVVTAGTDLDTLVDAGFYTMSWSDVYGHQPVAQGRRLLLVFPESAGGSFVNQIFLRLDTMEMWSRTRSGNPTTWGNWASSGNASQTEAFQLGSATYRKASSHGGFFDRSSKGTLYQNSPKAFLEARAAGVKYQEVDISLTSDGVPVVIHGPEVRPIGYESDIKVHDYTYAQILEMSFGDNDYSWNLQTLAETDALLKDLGCEMCLDIHYFGNVRSEWESLIEYLHENHIKPITISNAMYWVITNLASIDNTLPLSYTIYNTDDLNEKLTQMEGWVSQYDLTNPWVAIDYHVDATSYLSRLKNFGVIGYVLSAADCVSEIPSYYDVLMSETVNVNYERYKAVV